MNPPPLREVLVGDPMARAGLSGKIIGDCSNFRERNVRAKWVMMAFKFFLACVWKRGGSKIRLKVWSLDQGFLIWLLDCESGQNIRDFLNQPALVFTITLTSIQNALRVPDQTCDPLGSKNATRLRMDEKKNREETRLDWSSGFGWAASTVQYAKAPKIWHFSSYFRRKYVI